MSDENKEPKTYSIPPEGVERVRFVSTGRMLSGGEFDIEKLFTDREFLYPIGSAPGCPICVTFPESAGKTTLDLQLVKLGRAFEPLRLQLTRATENIASFLLRLEKLKHSRKKNRLPRKLKKELKKKGLLNTIPYRRGGVYV